MENEFLDKEQANIYYAGKAGVLSELETLPIQTIMKVFPGRQFVLFERTGTQMRVHQCLRVNVITMDRTGLCIIMKDVAEGSSLKIGYIPTQLRIADGRMVCLAIPSRCTVERTLRRSRYDKEDIRESMAAGILVRQASQPEEISDGALIFLPYEEFKRLTKRTISNMER